MQLKHQRGMSLLELMIGVAVGLLVVASSLVVYLGGVRTGTDVLRANRTNQDIREVMNLMVNDIRRAGYDASPVANTTNPFSVVGTTDITISGECILYSYDALHEGGTAHTVDAVDFFGFRRNANQIQIINIDAAAPATSTAATNCANDAIWVNLTDSQQLIVSSLTFDTIGSTCLAYDPATYNSADNTTYQTWKTTSGNSPACSANGAAAASGGAVAVNGAYNQFTEIRQIGITLVARHANDTAFTTGNAGLRDTVAVRNNRTATTLAP